MDKEQICYDLALIYARRMFGFYLEHRPRYDINKTESMAKKLFCFFEEAYNFYLNMDDREFRFMTEAAEPTLPIDEFSFNDNFPLFREN